jgi:hypothetical protein
MDDLVSPRNFEARRGPNLFFPDRAPAIKDVLAAAVKRMKEAKHHPNTVSVQFVQIGEDRKAKEALQEIVYSEDGVQYFCHCLSATLLTRKLNLAHG